MSRVAWAASVRIMTSPAPPSILLLTTTLNVDFVYGDSREHLAMIKGNGTCGNGTSDPNDPYGTHRPQRAFHLQVSLSAALGLVAFLAFCVRTRSIVFRPTC